jgi:hypothetical protein
MSRGNEVITRKKNRCSCFRCSATWYRRDAIRQ